MDWDKRLCIEGGVVRVSEVPLAKASLNKGDVFILDKGIYLYNIISFYYLYIMNINMPILN